MNPLRNLFIFLLGAWLIPPVSAQSDMFTKVFIQGSGAVQTWGMLKTPANNYLLAGCSLNQPMAMMISESGNIIWAKTYDTTRGNLYCASNTADGNILLAGALGAQQAGTMNDVLLVKITTLGDTIWSKKLDMGYEETPLSLKLVSDRGFILSGYSYDNSTPYYRSFVAKLDSSGNLQWGKTFYSGNYGNYAYTATETPDGGFLVSGSVAGTTTYYKSLLLAKLSSTGSLVWAEKYHDTPYENTVAYDAAMTSDNAVCYFVDESSSMSLMKIDLSGNVLWCKSMNFTGSFLNLKPGAKLHECSDGGFVFVNSAETSFGPLGCLLRTDSTGEVVWGQQLLLLTNDVSPTSNGGCLVAGNGPIIGVVMTSSDLPQIGTIKLNSQGGTYGCLMGGSPVATPISPGLIQATLTSAVAGTMSAAHCIIQDIVVYVDSGCVTVTGGIAETRGLVPLCLTPDPSGGKIRIETPQDPDASFNSLEVYNSTGENVYRMNLGRPGIREADLGFLANGLYMIRAVAGDRIYGGKLLIAH